MVKDENRNAVNLMATPSASKGQAKLPGSALGLRATPKAVVTKSGPMPSGTPRTRARLAATFVVPGVNDSLQDMFNELMLSS